MCTYIMCVACASVCVTVASEKGTIIIYYNYIVIKERGNNTKAHGIGGGHKRRGEKRGNSSPLCRYIRHNIIVYNMRTYYYIIDHFQPIIYFRRRRRRCRLRCRRRRRRCVYTLYLYLCLYAASML